MFGFGKKKKGNCCCCSQGKQEGHQRKFKNLISLSEASENEKYIVRFNPDKQTIEMGIAPGSIIYVNQNNIAETNLIIGVNDTRLVVPRQSAEQIKVK